MLDKVRTAAVLAFRFLFLTRQSWMLALALLGLPPLALVVAPALLENLFVLDRPIQMLNVSWISMLCATSVITTLHITTLNAADRFDDYRHACEAFGAAWGTSEHHETPWYVRWQSWVMLLLGLAASLGMWYQVVSACVSRTIADPGPAWMSLASNTGPWPSPQALSAEAWKWALIGMACTLAALTLSFAIRTIHRHWASAKLLEDLPYHGRPKDDTNTAGDDVVVLEQKINRFLAWLMGPGYFRNVVVRRGQDKVQQIIVAPGHAGLVMTSALFLAWYGWNYVSVVRAGAMPDETSPFPALFYGLLSLLLVILMLPGFAFFLDRHRIPTLPSMLILMALLYSVFGTDHYYELSPGPQRDVPVSTTSWDELLEQRVLPSGNAGPRTLIVVDASGGGIQASAWTAQVLTGLHEIYGDRLTQSIGLISSVSGGSVGSAFYLTCRADMAETYDPRVTDTVLSPEAINRIRVAARASGLEASCWGIAYPDTMRAVFPPLTSDTIDRGWSIEQNWRKRIEAHDLSLADLRLGDIGKRISASSLPVPVFNATLVETGQRLLISPVLAPPEVGEQPHAGVEFLRAFPQSQLRMFTAARLSATFPYVTPVARSRASGTENAIEGNGPISELHVADGAYADNEGAVTSVDWINRLLMHYSRAYKMDDRPFDRVLLIRIQAFPEKNSASSPPTNSLSGWSAVLLGPFHAMMNVRSASQMERGDLEINLLTRATRSELQAAKERTERDFQSALAQVSQLETIRDSLRQLVTDSGDTHPDIQRQVLHIEDQLRYASEFLKQSQDNRRRLDQLQVESVVFDFQPVDGVRIPMSWKLTSRQKLQIDHAWEQLVQGSYPHRPLEIIDKYFRRMTSDTATPHIAERP